jgi:hypothetical protein
MDKYLVLKHYMDTSNIAIQEFQQVHGIISLHRSRALQIRIKDYFLYF